jgi:rubrerythrin
MEEEVTLPKCTSWLGHRFKKDESLPPPKNWVCKRCGLKVEKIDAPRHDHDYGNY